MAWGSDTTKPRAAALDGEAPRAPGPVGQILLARIAAEGGATRAEVARELAPLFNHKLSPADWKRTAEVQTGQLVASGLVTDTRGRLAPTDDGRAVAAKYLGAAGASRPWAELRDVWLTAKALGLEGESASKLKALLRQDSLRGLIVQRAFGLPLKKNQPAAKLRAQLALIALERAFGNKVKAGFGPRDALPAKAGRLLACQLLKSPREFGTDARLIAELAAEHAGAKDADADALRLGLLQGLGARALAALDSERSAPVVTAQRVVPIPANDQLPPAAAPPSARPDLSEFTRKVQAAAAGNAEGWPGNRKAFISRVWNAIRQTESQWGISEIEFKCMLAEAHRAGRITLSNADLKDKKNLQELESSAVLYKNAVWHFVRVEE